MPHRIYFCFGQYYLSHQKSLHNLKMKNSMMYKRKRRFVKKWRTTSLHRCRWRPQGFVCVRCLMYRYILYLHFKGSSLHASDFYAYFPIVCKQLFSTFKHLIYFNYLHAYYWNEANSLRNFSSFSSSSQPLLPSSIALCVKEKQSFFSKRRTEKETRHHILSLKFPWLTLIYFGEHFFSFLTF